MIRNISPVLSTIAGVPPHSPPPAPSLVSFRRLRGSTGTANKETASRIAAEIEAKAWKRRLDGPAAILTFAQAAIKYRAAGKQTRFLERIEDYWKDTLVQNITPGAIHDAALALYPRATAATRNRQAIVPMQAVINHAANSELCARIRVKRFKVETKSRNSSYHRMGRSVSQSLQATATWSAGPFHVPDRRPRI